MSRRQCASCAEPLAAVAGLVGDVVDRAAEGVDRRTWPRAARAAACAWRDRTSCPRRAAARRGWRDVGVHRSTAAPLRPPQAARGALQQAAHGDRRRTSQSCRDARARDSGSRACKHARQLFGQPLDHRYFQASRDRRRSGRRRRGAARSSASSASGRYRRAWRADCGEARGRARGARPPRHAAPARRAGYRRGRDCGNPCAQSCR